MRRRENEMKRERKRDGEQKEEQKRKGEENQLELLCSQNMHVWWKHAIFEKMNNFSVKKK